MGKEGLPFTYDQSSTFFEKLSEWIGDVFYDLLPEKGFELRDEQVYMAFQLEQAFKKKSVIFSEAGVGTGKTIVYLLYAIMYARYIGRPAIIACADESLIEQLVKEEGDIKKLEEALNLTIDVRLAKSPDQYLCLKKLEKFQDRDDVDEDIDSIFDVLPDFVFDYSTMQKFHPYGDRKEFPKLNDESWRQVSWDVFQDCFTCQQRHRCGQTLSRDDYRRSQDLIICSHDFYMQHVWTYEARKREGQLPLLPEASAVIFDEGHLVEVASQKALTYQLNEEMLSKPLLSLLANDIRESLATAVEHALQVNELFFEQLRQDSVEITGSDRYEINRTKQLMDYAHELKARLEKIDEEIVLESEMYTIDQYELNVASEHFDEAEYAISLFLKEGTTICWTIQDESHITLITMPKMVGDVLREKVFSKKIPYIFSSATMSENGSFDYVAKSLGIDEYDSFSVASPFDYAERMKVSMPVIDQDHIISSKLAFVQQALEKTNGRALVLVNTKEELETVREAFSNKWSFVFEGDRELSQIVRKFQLEPSVNLCARSLWEGLDIPGESLSHVIIFSLPFPPNDPVFQAKKQDVADPYHEVELPYMLLRMRQGIGRLIRTADDRGWITILDERLADEKLASFIQRLIPENVTIEKQ